MATIVGRRPVPRKPAWIAVEWNDGETVEIPLSDWVELGLSLGRDVADDVRELLRERAEQATYRERTLRWLGRRPRTVAETTAYLRRIGASERCAKSVVEDLLRAGWLDDARYARAVVAAQQDRCSRAELRKTLVTRGVSPQVVSDLLAGGDAREAEYDAARHVAEKYWRTHSSVPIEHRRLRMARYLQNRGFPLAVIRRILQEPAFLSDVSEADDAFLDSDWH
jgi:regulatory protein